MAKTNNNDTGSLKVGVVPCKVGDSIQIEGEKTPRLVTYIMGKGEKCHACCAGTGPFPMGEVVFEILAQEE